jgi:dihydrofolate reductase
MSADGVIDAPTWTFDYGFPDKQAEAITAFAQGCKGILLGRTTFEMFSTAWPQRTAEEDPGAPFFNDTTKYVVSGSRTDASIWQNSDGLIDGLHLFVFPLTRGSGPRLFAEGASPKKLSLAGSDRYENGVVYLNYRPQA